MQTPYSTYTEMRLPKADAYRNLIEGTRVHLLRDGSTKTFSERHIQCVWFDPALRPKQLSARSGETVEVLDAGRWNQEAGPDFLDAILLIKPELRRIEGDVEVHIHPTDWEHHGHAADPRYSRVIAHVTYFPGLAPPDGLPTGTIEIALESGLQEQPAFQLESIDTSAYPFAARIQSCTCAILLKEKTSVDAQSLLHAAGCYRFEQKTRKMLATTRHSTINDVLYHKTMEALGYKQHREAFLELAARVPLSIIQNRTPFEAYAILMGTAGLLPDAPSSKTPPESMRFIRKLWDFWWQHRSNASTVKPINWHGPAGRPANQPTRRLAAAAMLFTTPEPWKTITNVLQTGATSQSLQHLFAPHESLTFWLYHTSFETQPSEKPRALVGKDRIAAWLNNVVLPLAAATGTPMEDVLVHYKPEQINAIVRHTAARLLGRDHNPALYRRSGILQQGLLQIFQDYCSGGCHNCALADALQQGVFQTIAEAADIQTTAPDAPHNADSDNQMA